MITQNFSGSIRTRAFLYPLVLLTGTIGYILLSPKWTVPIFAWLAPGCMLLYFRYAVAKRKILWFTLALLSAKVIAAQGVVPFPWPVLVVISMIEVIKVLLVYLLDRWVVQKDSRFVMTLLFPAAYVAKEFFDFPFSGGAWWSIANTQYPFKWLIQLNSITGIAGISFLIYWFASVMTWSFAHRHDRKVTTKALGIYAFLFTAVLVFGAYRYRNNALAGKPAVKIAGLTVPNFGVLESIYRDATGKSITVDPKWSLTSTRLQEINATLLPFIETADSSRFPNGFAALHRLQDSLFILSAHAVADGAKMIIWSEGNAILFHSMQEDFIRRAATFAAKSHIYLLAAMVVLDPGKLTPGSLFMENKTLLFGPDGKILNVFHKNHPVPLAEHSKPGDGKIPVIQTPYGRLSVSICYDADFPADMRQLARQQSDLLMLPSGDWYAIAPYHSQMAVFRGLENGCSVLRQANGGLSLVTDYRGKVQASFDFYRPGEKYWTANVITGHVPTVYALIGDVIPYAGIVLILMLTGLAGMRQLKRKRIPAVQAEHGWM